MNNTIIILSIVLLIVAIEFSVDKKLLGIIILHNNDHTLNKVLQNIVNIMHNHLIHYQILVIKEKYPNKKRSTGYLFNVGIRQLSGFSNYLFIDTQDCNLKNYFSVNSTKINKDELFVKDKINYFDKLCSIGTSKHFFKKIDGFSNKPNNSFNSFIKNLEKEKSDKYGGYFSMNLNVEYDIVNRIMVNKLTTIITIKYI